MLQAGISTPTCTKRSGNFFRKYSVRVDSVRSAQSATTLESFFPASTIPSPYFQDETTLHNVNFADNVIFEALFWGSVFGLIGGLWCLEYNLRGISDRMRLILPSLVLVSRAARRCTTAAEESCTTGTMRKD